MYLLTLRTETYITPPTTTTPFILNFFSKPITKGAKDRILQVRHNHPPHLEYLVLASPTFLASFSVVSVEDGKQVSPALRGLPEPSGSLIGL